ncbi:MAG: iron ABC transporter permease [Alphaproteobacteria bacterium]|nr:MAG: iron ABC transporter permease [Alphaproteobacteria bacterium]
MSACSPVRGVVRPAGAALGRLVAGARWGLAIAALGAVVLLAVGQGRYHVPTDEAIRILLSGLVPIETTWSPSAERVVTLLRLPRVLSAALAGAALGGTGCVLQGIFRNPLVGPQMVGVTAGASFGGALAILMLGSALAIVGLAFVGGFAAIALVYLVSRAEMRTPIFTLVLAGIVVSAGFSALVSLLKYVADPNNALPAIVYWLMGSFAMATYPKLGILAASTAVGLGLVSGLWFRINVLSLGEEDAAAVGLAVERTRWLVLAAVALAVAGVVAVAGAVGWVGLIVPHVARMLVGPNHRVLIPASALVGAGYLVAIDALARTVTQVEIPVGVLTALVGAPVFVVLLRRLSTRGWGRG